MPSTAPPTQLHPAGLASGVVLIAAKSEDAATDEGALVEEELCQNEGAGSQGEGSEGEGSEDEDVPVEGSEGDEVAHQQEKAFVVVALEIC